MFELLSQTLQFLGKALPRRSFAARRRGAPTPARGQGSEDGASASWSRWLTTTSRLPSLDSACKRLQPLLAYSRAGSAATWLHYSACLPAKSARTFGQAAAQAATEGAATPASTSTTTPSISGASLGSLNVVRNAGEGDILRGLKVGALTWTGEGRIRLLLQRWSFEDTAFFQRLLPGQTVTLRVEGIHSKKGKCTVTLLGTESPAPGQRPPPCAHFHEGCSGCQFLHLNPPYQWKAKQQLVAHLLHELLTAQRQQAQVDGIPCREPDVEPLVRARSDTQFSAKADLLVQHMHGKACIGLPPLDGSSTLVSIERCLRLAAPLQEVYNHLRATLLPLLESGKLRVLDSRSYAGTLSGVTLKLAARTVYMRVAQPFPEAVIAGGLEGAGASDREVLLRFKGHLEDSTRPVLEELAVALSSLYPALKAVTFQDVRRPHLPDQVLYGKDFVLMTLEGCRYRTTGKAGQCTTAFARSLSHVYRIPPAPVRSVVSAAVAEAARGGRRRLWTAFESGGIFAVLLAPRFEKVIAFAAGALDAEEARKNYVLNGLQVSDVVECKDSRWGAHIKSNERGIAANTKAQGSRRVLGRLCGFHVVAAYRSVAAAFAEHLGIQGHCEMPRGEAQRVGSSTRLSSLCRSAVFRKRLGDRLLARMHSFVLFAALACLILLRALPQLQEQASGVGTPAELHCADEEATGIQGSDRTVFGDATEKWRQRQPEAAAAAGRDSAACPSTVRKTADAAAEATARPDILLLAPSRGGLPKASIFDETRRWLKEGAVAYLVYVSHEQPAFARDAKVLLACGYELEYFRAFDVSPHRTEVLSVSSFSRKNIGRFGSNSAEYVYGTKTKKEKLRSRGCRVLYGIFRGCLMMVDAATHVAEAGQRDCNSAAISEEDNAELLPVKTAVLVEPGISLVPS
ncbi:putative RNA methyltransferase, TrmA family [Cyclospora cayetanensis]|uniref:RNA methyltransferase, TrmA family n=1 Tax=Cyclospora cayetanensis TaxID=88456 RepID=A0A1D3CUN6_9EIME|nr:putative RNA methyltransferase, TrmA family [Cyclospora cayetanensis]